ATMCGNGSRAAALYAFKHGLCGRELAFQTGAGRICAQVLENEHIAVQFPFVRILQDNLQECAMPAFLLDTGVPHLVLCAHDDVELVRPTSEELRALRVRYDANVDVMCVAQNTVHVRTFERGVEAETLACGTGMAACFVVAHHNGQLGDEGIVIPASDEKLHFYFAHDFLWFSGKVQHVATCKTDMLSF
ncbi:MAG: diaminopimelate epimerase, partial [Helicobacter sp.]|nr:diaminopimelate epimerase [Helicobacter sp.]